MLVAMVGVTVFSWEMQMVAATSGRREGAQVAHRGHCAGKRGLQQKGRIRSTTGQVLDGRCAGTIKVVE